MSLNRISRSCLKAGMVALAAMVFVWSAPTARAGAIRYAGKMVMKGTAVAAAATAAGTEAAAGKVQSEAVPATANASSSIKHTLVHVGHATTNGAKDGGAAIYYSAKRAPHAVAHGAKALWHVVW